MTICVLTRLLSTQTSLSVHLIALHCVCGHLFLLPLSVGVVLLVMIAPGVWDGYLTEDKKRVSFVARVKSKNGYFTCSGVVSCQGLCRRFVTVHCACVCCWKQDARERQFVVSGRVKSSPPFAFTGGMNFVQNKEQMKQIAGWREVGTGGLYGEWSQRGVVGGTFSMQPTIAKERREFWQHSTFSPCLVGNTHRAFVPPQRSWSGGWCTLRRRTAEGCCARWAVTTA